MTNANGRTEMSDAENDPSLFGADKTYYKQLLMQNYIRDLPRKSIDNCLQMEHSYSRDWRPMEGAQVMTTRTILVHRPPQCPSCHVPASDEIRVDMSDQYSPPIPPYNEEAAKAAMEDCERMAANVRNGSTDDDDWEKRIDKFGWSQQQNKLFARIVQILDLDQLSRLANKEKQHEAVLRRAAVDKSVSRIRQALASVAWEPRLTQWLHILLMDNLSPSYLASYLDILQTLKAKTPTLVDKMVFGRPIHGNHEILGPVLKKPWEPCVVHKSRKLPGQAIIIIAPSTPQTQTPPSSRTQRWYSLLASMANVVPVQMNVSSAIMQKQSFSFISDQMVAACRQKIQEVRNEMPGRQIILLGFNAGASLALQVGLTEQLSSIVCLGFAFNTINGVRGEPDDRILELTTPVLFVEGQISARSSQEEIESLREKMQAQTSLVVVGSADDSLRVSKNKRKIEGVTQSMVDNMITDEIYEFASTCILNPPGPRDLAMENAKLSNGNNLLSTSSNTLSSTHMIKKRKHSQSDAETSTPIKQPKLKDLRDGKLGHVPRKVGRPRIRPASPKRPKHALLQQPTTEALNMAIQSIMPAAIITTASTTPKAKDTLISGNVTNLEIASSKIDTPTTPKPPQFSVISSKPRITFASVPKPSSALSAQRPLQKVKIISPNQLVHLKQTHMASQPKTFTLKPSPKLTLTTSGTPQQLFTVRTPTPSKTDNQPRPANKIFTVKSIPSTTQHLGNIQVKTQPMQPNTSPLIISPTKFTIIKPPINNQLNFKLSTPQTVATTKSNPDLSSTNIFDIPIVFADSDGNIQDNTQVSAGSSIDPNVKQLVQNRSIVINNVVQPRPAMQNKVMLINRNQVKPVPNILSKSIPPLKYTKVVVSNPNILSSVQKTDGLKPSLKLNITPMSKVELMSSGLLKTTCSSITSATTSVTAPTTIGKFQPIVINVDSDKTTIKNMITVNESQVKPNTILIKPGGIRPMPMIKPGILNRNLTVKRLNLIPQQKIITATTTPIVFTTNNSSTSVPPTIITTQNSNP